MDPFALQLERAASLLRALADAPRLHILKVLDKNETCVSDIAKALNDKLSTVSQRLRILRAEGLVKKRRAGKQLFLLACGPACFQSGQQCARSCRGTGITPRPLIPKEVSHVRL